MTARANPQMFQLDQAAPVLPARSVAAAVPAVDRTPVAYPAPAQFSAVVELVRSVFKVPAVTITLHGAVAEAERGVWRSFLESPLIREGETIGALRVLDTVERGFDERDCVLLEGFARLVVEQVELWAEASRDVLTGAMTRRAFQDVLSKSVAASRRQAGQAALILFDLDHFKFVNDSLGHAAGDAVLKATARKVLGELRLEDSLGRIGGEEFALLISGADLDAGLEVAERVRAAIARMEVPGHPDLSVTASFGVVTLDPGAQPESLMIAADRALYEAKQGGRNQVRTGSAADAAAQDLQV